MKGILLLTLALLGFNANATLISKTLLPFFEPSAGSETTFYGEGYISFSNSSRSLISAFGANALYTQSLVQIDLRQVTKENLLSATLEFLFLDGTHASQYTRFRGVNTNGKLNATLDTSNFFYSKTQSTTKARTNRFNLLPMINRALENDVNWLGINISTRSGNDLYTRVSNSNIDRAKVRLKMDLKTTQVAEPSSIWLLSIVFSFLVLRHWRRVLQSR